jgi:hypothetical protein
LLRGLKSPILRSTSKSEVRSAKFEKNSQVVHMGRPTGNDKNNKLRAYEFLFFPARTSIAGKLALRGLGDSRGPGIQMAMDFTGVHCSGFILRAPEDDI